MHLVEGRLEPAGVIVIGDGAAIVSTITSDVRRVGQNEINRAPVERAHHVDAVGIENHIAGGARGAGHVFYSFGFRVQRSEAPLLNPCPSARPG